VLPRRKDLLGGAGKEMKSLLGFVYMLTGENLWRMPLASIFAAIATYLLCYPVIYVSHRFHLLDRPGHRSSHSQPTPRTGGLAIVLGALIGVLLCFQPRAAFLVIIAIGAVVAAVSLFDDIVSVPPIPRLLVQLVVAAASIYLVGLIPNDIGLPFLTLHLGKIAGFILAFIFVVGFVNAFNFIDGMNGLAASQGVWGGVVVSLLLFTGHGGNSVYTAAALAGACLGFFPHNFPKARLFMGDVGAITVGFGMAMLTLVGGSRTDVPWMAFVIPFMVTIYDPFFTVIKRVLQGHNPLKPHREFHFHLLLRCGWSHDDNTRLQNLLMATCAVLGLTYAWVPAEIASPVRLAILLLLALLFPTYSVLVHRYFRRHCTEDSPDAETAELDRADESDGTGNPETSVLS
jgi:UDP-N-acetylmuramyl pentapeptide phosphotransferase/UDP-N-acetylglucosamine-1-phosphate transferase